MQRQTAWLGWLVVPIVVGSLAACAGDDSESSLSANPNPATTSASTSVESTSTAVTTTAAGTTTTATTAPPTTVAPHVCPQDAMVSSAVGQPMVFDTNAPVKADGFCPYTSADGSGNVIVSVTYTPLNVTADAGPTMEQIAGLGQSAIWGGGELSVWTGKESIIAGVLAFGQGPEFDDRAVAINLATALLAAG